ncbi:ejaculatory bulb-specific protein 3-like isoform X2 [Thrips palmi]|uniref:Ejaculatory bulb-specific protein 3-like isoform X2 n=1 Tax=Thrips palmi TaxID=161013 RepID=A0A6P8Z5Z4_THRPL|nr:ejaculatory bulb-specific protein 3-like isoform X2 [Thrips palmi]
MMTKTVVGLCLVAALCLGFSSAATFDGVDVAALLKNDTAVQSYVKSAGGNSLGSSAGRGAPSGPIPSRSQPHLASFHPLVKCILGTGECSESAKRLQAIVPNALQQKCSQCTEQQKIIIGTIVAKMQKSFPADWEKLLQKYDPEKKHRENILALAKAVPTGLPATTPKPK